MNVRLRLLALTLVAPLAVACGDDGSGESDTDDSGTSAPTTTSSTSTSTTDSSTSSTTTDGSSSTTDPTTSGTGTGGSSGGSTGEADLDVTINFSMVAGGVDVACGTTYANMGSTNETVTFQDARFYVSNIRLIDDGDVEVPIELTDDGAWQVPADNMDGTNGLVLLDFENGTGGCDTGTTAETNSVVLGTVPPGNYVGLAFDVGVPFDKNHLDVDAMDTPPALSQAGMWWSWAAGYKHMRIDLRDSMDTRWNFHLGAQGCDNGGAGADVPPTEECTRPARPHIRLAAFDWETQTVQLDTTELFGDSDVTSNTMNTPPGCQSFVMNEQTECEPLWPNLGLDWTAGDCMNDCSGQTVFSAQ
jgi:uncharacterized repeat protein (TIGR04052 family)